MGNMIQEMNDDFQIFIANQIKELEGVLKTKKRFLEKLSSADEDLSKQLKDDIEEIEDAMKKRIKISFALER